MQSWEYFRSIHPTYSKTYNNIIPIVLQKMKYNRDFLFDIYLFRLIVLLEYLF